MLDFQAARYLMDGEVPKQAGNDHPTSIPTGVFPTADGHINIAVAGQEIYERFCKAMDAPQLMTKPEYATGALRSQNRVALNAEIAELTRTRPSAYWIEMLNKAGCPSGPIYTMDQVFADPQVQHDRMAVPLAHPRLGEIQLVGQAIKMNRTPMRMRTATPDLGEHTDAVLHELGYDAAAVARLRQNGAV